MHTSRCTIHTAHCILNTGYWFWMVMQKQFRYNIQSINPITPGCCISFQAVCCKCVFCRTRSVSTFRRRSQYCWLVSAVLLVVFSSIVGCFQQYCWLLGQILVFPAIFSHRHWRTLQLGDYQTLVDFLHHANNDETDNENLDVFRNIQLHEY